MKRNSTEFKERIYDLMNGYFNTEECEFPESEIVENEFEEDKFCSIRYKEVYDAKVKLCSRLGEDENKEIETMISGLLAIGKYQCFKMYDYGMYFSYEDA